MKMICDVPDEVIKSIKDGTYCGSFMVEKMIAKGIPLSSSENPNRWIPVSERLPENHDDVLVWVEYIKDDYDCAWWALAYYSRQHKKWVVSTNGRNPIVKAWMPLPEPYKASPTGAESEG